ncbi:MAG: hypothetical protein OHK0022_41760 [Roseiflexaceae bacterium]
MVADSIFLIATPIIVAVIVMLLRHFQTKALASRYHLRWSDRHIAIAGSLLFMLIGFARAFVQNGSVATLTPMLSGLAWAAAAIATGLLLRRLQTPSK